MISNRIVNKIAKKLYYQKYYGTVKKVPSDYFCMNYSKLSNKDKKQYIENAKDILQILEDEHILLINKIDLEKSLGAIKEDLNNHTN